MKAMIEIILLIIGCLLALLFFIWLAFGRRAASKAATLFMDTGLLALCVAAVLCGLLLRQEKYKNDREQAALLKDQTENQDQNEDRDQDEGQAQNKDQDQKEDQNEGQDANEGQDQKEDQNEGQDANEDRNQD